MVTKSIVFTLKKGFGLTGAPPPINTDLVELPTVATVYLACVKSPNFDVTPSDAISTSLNAAL